MRTTTVIDDAVFRQARLRAQRLHLTLSGLIEDAQRAAPSARPSTKPKRRPFKLIVNQGPGLAPGFAGRPLRARCLAATETGCLEKLVADAYHAARAIEHGCEWRISDGDFARFFGLRWRHPLAR